GRVAIFASARGRRAGAGPAVGGPTLRRALGGRVTHGTENDFLVSAVPIVDDENEVGAVRASAPVDVVEARTHRTWLEMAGLGIVALGVAAAVGRRQARRLATPVRALAATAARLGEGDFGVRAARSGRSEEHTSALQ